MLLNYTCRHSTMLQGANLAAQRPPKNEGNVPGCLSQPPITKLCFSIRSADLLLSEPDGQVNLILSALNKEVTIIRQALIENTCSGSRLPAGLTGDDPE
jgi:hypothetical protein